MSYLRLAFKPIVLCFLYGVMQFISPLAKAQAPLSLSEAIQMATQNQPLLQSLSDASTSSREAAIAEGQLPDPKIKFGVTNLPITDSNAFRLDREDMTMMNIGFAQDITPQNKREALSNRYIAEAEQYDTEQMAIAKTIERDVALAWLDVYEAERKTELYRQLIQDITSQRKTLTSKISSNKAAASDVLVIDRDLSLIKEKLIFAQRDESKARASLSRWIGQSASRPISAELPTVNDEFNHDEIQKQIELHPLVKNAFQLEKVAKYELDSAQANLESNWGWEVGYGKRFNDRSDMLSFQVSIDLQLDRANRQDKRTAEKLALVEKAQNLTDDRRLMLLSELDSVIADAKAAEELEKEITTKLIPIAQAKLKTAQALYKSGKQMISDVWLARREMVEVELDQLNVITDKQRAAIRIGYFANNHPLLK